MPSLPPAGREWCRLALPLDAHKSGVVTVIVRGEVPSEPCKKILVELLPARHLAQPLQPLVEDLAATLDETVRESHQRRPRRDRDRRFAKRRLVRKADRGLRAELHVVAALSVEQ